MNEISIHKDFKIVNPCEICKCIIIKVENHLKSHLELEKPNTLIRTITFKPQFAIIWQTCNLTSQY